MSKRKDLKKENKLTLPFSKFLHVSVNFLLRVLVQPVCYNNSGPDAEGEEGPICSTCMERVKKNTDPEDALS